MEFLAQNEKVIFVGQAVSEKGTGMSNTLQGVPLEKRKEFPVCEDFQQGFCNGLALNSYIPISIFPRWNFLLLATNQIVNHLDKIPMISDYRPKVIIRVGIGSERPLHPQWQHIGDYSSVFRSMCPNMEIIRLDESEQIFPAYEKALARTDGKSTILVEYSDFYNEK